MSSAAPQPEAAGDTFDVGVQQVANLYAKAFLGAGEAAGETEKLLDELHSVVVEVLDAHPNFEKLLGSTMVAHEDKVEILDRVLGGQTSPRLLNFLKVLSRHGRLDALRAIEQTARLQFDALRGRVHVEVRTAHSLDDAAKERITQALKGMLDREPVLDVTIDPDVIAGLVLRVGDRVYDGSVATRLERVRQKMIERSVHEIQSGRDRFRHST